MNAATPSWRWVLMGAGGHGSVLRAVLCELGLNVLGVCDPALVRDGTSTWQGLPVLGGDEALARLNPQDLALALGVGPRVRSTHRREVFERLRQQHHRFPPLVHPRAWVAPGVTLAEGVQVMAGVVIQPGCHIGENTLVNTCSSVDHDCQVGSHVHIAPGATLCGGVSVGRGCFIGAGATVIQEIQLGENALLSAGFTLTKNLSDGLKYPEKITTRPAPRSPE